MTRWIEKRKNQLWVLYGVQAFFCLLTLLAVALEWQIAAKLLMGSAILMILLVLWVRSERP